MNLSNLFDETWKEVESAYAETPVQIYTEDDNRNQSVFVLAFYKAIEPRLSYLHAMYDARCLSDQSYRPNFVIWAGEDEPIVIFMGDLKFNPESLIEAQQSIVDLNAYTNKTQVEVITCHSNTDLMKVSADVEFGCFVVSDKDHEIFSQGIASQMLSTIELTRFHFAYGSIPQEDGKVNFNYQKPLSAGMDK